MQQQTATQRNCVKVQVEVKNARSATLIRLADERQLQEQMREITERLGSSVMKVGETDLPPAQNR